ncbi:MAG: hydantoinase/oxoprolinase family protein, partial [Acidimicrobiales bacterium]
LDGLLKVGPQSAGAVPGPACYGRGGMEPTVTDANVVLGYLPTSLLGGEMSLDRDAAFTAVESVAKALGVETMRAAAGIIDIVNENMFGALRLVSVQQGYDPRNYALIAFGGAGPLHANALGSLMGSWPVIIPPSPGVLCAYGDATTELRSESSRTLIRRFSETSLEEVVGILAELTHDAGIEISREGVDEAHRNVLYEIDLRYHGQGFEVPISITLDELKEHGLALAAARFDAEHERLFTFALDSEHEIVNLRSTITAVSTRLDAIKLAGGDGDPAQAFVSTTTLWTGEEMEEGKLYDRTKLEAGDVIVGPAIVSEMDSTTLLLPKHVGTIDEYGCIIIQPTNNTQETER